MTISMDGGNGNPSWDRRSYAGSKGSDMSKSDKELLELVSATYADGLEAQARIDGRQIADLLDERDSLKAALARLESEFAVAMQAANVSEKALRAQLAQARGVADALQVELDEARRVLAAHQTALAGCRDLLRSVP